MANPNIVNVTAIYGKTSFLSVTTTTTAILSNSASSGTVIKVNSLYVSNVDGSNAADINGTIYNGSTDYNIASTISVPADTTLVLISKDTSIYLEEGQSVRLAASANGDLEAVISYEVIS